MKTLAALIAGVVLGSAGYATAGPNGSVDPQARQQIAQLRAQAAATAAAIDRLAAIMDRRLYKLCKATVTNVSYTGCEG